MNWATFVFVVFVFSNIRRGSSGNDGEIISRVPMDNLCMSCICVAISGCDKTLKCEADVCGMFRITKGFWIDAGRLKLSNEDVSASDDQAYRDCTNDEKCSVDTTFNYLTGLAQDCDGNNIIDCYDYAAIHKYGGFGGCTEKPLTNSASYFGALKTCLDNPSQAPVIPAIPVQ